MINVGDKVLVLINKDNNMGFGYGSYNDRMSKFYYKIMTVRSYYEYGGIFMYEDINDYTGNLDDSGWCWKSNWLKKIEIGE